MVPTPTESDPPSKATDHRSERIKVILVMGVSGSGKTTIGTLLARALGWAFVDADVFHPAANLAKMHAGQPLNDADRAPWLGALRERIRTALQRNEPLILACSALREDYRSQLVINSAAVRLVHLAGNFDLIRQRLAHRTDHFMPPALLQSQFDTLETPADALTVDVAESPARIVARIRHAFSL